MGDELLHKGQIGGKVNLLAGSVHLVDVRFDKDMYMVNDTLNVDLRAGLYNGNPRVYDGAPAFKLERTEGYGAKN